MPDRPPSRPRGRRGASIPLPLALALLCAPPRPGAAQPPAPLLADFDALLQGIERRYAYLDRGRTDLAQIRQRLRERARLATSKEQLIPILEQALEPLADGHATLGTNLPSSTRLIPSGLDLWAEWRGAQALVTEVRRGWPADLAGIRPGDQILAVNGADLATAFAQRLPCCCDAQAAATRRWTLLALLAGTHDQPRRLTLLTRQGRREFALGNPDEVPAPPPISHARLAAGIGYIAVRHLGDPATVPAFDAALRALRDSRALILDLRDTAAGGSTAVAEPIMGRFLRRRGAYQRIVPLAGRPWLRTVAPRGPFAYDGPLAVLVGRFTGSMGEGMAMGLSAMKRATVIGGPMAGLLGAVYSYTLPRSGIRYQLPGDRLTHPDGTPREAFLPAVRVEDGAPGEDPALARALAVLGAP